MTKATTLYLDSKLLHAFKIKAVETHTSVSKLVNESLKLSLKEDALDIQAIADRKNQKLTSFEDVLKGLKKDGLV